MDALRRFWVGLLALLGRREDARALEAELRAYVEAAAEAKLRAGMSRDAAWRASRVEMGSAEAVKENIRAAGWETTLETIGRDLGYGARMLRRNPSFTAAALLTLALGIGANTAIFSVANALLWRPLPYPQAKRIVHLSWKFPRVLSSALTVPQFEFWRDRSKSYASLAGIRGEWEMELGEGPEAEWVKGLQVTDGFLRTFGVSPALGRGFLRQDTEPGAAGAVVLTDALWRNAFHRDPKIIGKQIKLDAEAFTVRGVLPANFAFSDPPDYPDAPDLFVALHLGNALDDRGTNTEVMGRLQPAISLGQAQAEAPVLSQEFEAGTPAAARDAGELEVDSYRSYQASEHRAVLLLLLGAVGLLLLIACANVASLLLARATARRREMAMRLALGAGRGRLLRQFLTESVLLGLTGAAAGFGLAALVLRAAVSAIPWNLPVTAHIRQDGRVLLFTLLVGVGASVVFGLTGYFQSRGIDWSRTLQEGRAVAGVGRGGLRALKLLVIGEVAISLMLALGAGLLIESLYRLYQQNLGFDPARIVTIETAPLPGRTVSAAARFDSELRALGRLRAIPGVDSAALTSDMPFGGQDNFPCQREGHPEESIGGMEFREVSPEYFSTMRIPLLRGRGFLPTDSAAAPPVALIDETLARRWWPGGNPVGDRIVLGEFRGQPAFQTSLPPVTVVGVVGDTRMTVAEPARPMIYISVAQNRGMIGNGSMDWVVRARRGASVGVELRAAIAQAAPGLRVVSLRPMTEMIGAAVAQPRFNALLLGMFGALALALTLVGIYGVLGFQLSQRAHEIGVRIALGAEPRDVVRLIVGQAGKLAGIGVALGILGAMAASRLLSSLLYEVKPLDAGVYAAAAASLLLVALAASYVPARRAMRVDPMKVLRSE